MAANIHKEIFFMLLFFIKNIRISIGRSKGELPIGDFWETHFFLNGQQRYEDFFENNAEKHKKDLSHPNFRFRWAFFYESHLSEMECPI
jgi:hypothetical protein